MKTKEYRRDYYARHRDRLRGYYRAYYNQNKNRRRETMRKYRQGEKGQAARKAYVAKRANEIKESGKLYREKNKPRIAAQQKAYHIKNSARRYAVHSSWIKKNRKHVRAYARAYYVKNRDSFKKRDHRRNHALSIGRDKIIEQFIESLGEKRTVVCYYCRSKVRKYHIDHIVPISKGGLHRIDNLCASCVKCNLSKGAKLLAEWVKNLPQVILPI